MKNLDTMMDFILHYIVYPLFTLMGVPRDDINDDDLWQDQEYTHPKSRRNAEGQGPERTTTGTRKNMTD